MRNARKVALLVLAGVFLLDVGGAHAQSRNVDATQDSWAYTRAELNAGIRRIGENVDLTTAAINNSASVSLNRSVGLDVSQIARQGASAISDISVVGVGESVSSTAAAIGNSLSVDLDGAVRAARRRRSDVEVNQVADGATLADLNLYQLQRVGGDVAGTSAALSNSASVSVNRIRRAELGIEQVARAPSTAEMYARISRVGEDVSLTTAAIGNSASLDLERVRRVGIDAVQTNTGARFAELSSIVRQVEDDVDVTAAAIGNSFSANSLPRLSQMDASLAQGNTAYVSAVADIRVGAIGDDVAATAAAIGNSLTIATDGF